jgi:hypothetical protein
MSYRTYTRGTPVQVVYEGYSNTGGTRGLLLYRSSETLKNDSVSVGDMVSGAIPVLNYATTTRPTE